MTVETNLDQLELLLAEKRYYFALLRVWAAAKDSGFESDQVATFTFREDFLTTDQRTANLRARITRKNPPFNDALYHNAVRLKTGEVKQIKLTTRPEPPAHMKVSKQEKS